MTAPPAPDAVASMGRRMPQSPLAAAIELSRKFLRLIRTLFAGMGHPTILLRFNVIPAKANRFGAPRGGQEALSLAWIPIFAGMTAIKSMSGDIKPAHYLFASCLEHSNEL